MVEQLKVLLDAAHYRESLYEQFGPDYRKWLIAAELRSALESALQAAEVVKANP